MRIGVAFKAAGPILHCDAGALAFALGDEVVVEDENGPRIGRVVVPAAPVAGAAALSRVLRLATDADRAKEEWARARGRAALKLAYQRSNERKLGMKLVSVDFNSSGTHATVFFGADERVDFRGLVKDLATELGVRVEMRQIGPRDAAKEIGGLGPCGRELCCSSFLHEFEPVSIKMAKDQGLALNPQKISGVCGRLLCCLAYEHEGYVENAKEMPKVGKMVMTPKGRGKVVSQQILEKRVRVLLLSDGTVDGFDAKDVTREAPPPPTPPKPKP